MPAKKLGFGLMRLPMQEKAIDLEKTKAMVDLFLEKGFTYFDTAWMYCGHKSEDAVKEVLVSRHPRGSYTLATKLHVGFVKTMEDRDRIFNEQRRKTGVAFFDYYLLHDINASSIGNYEKFDCFRWIQQKKADGLVKHIGFSFHDGPELLDKVLSEHPEFEFVQLQINYLDWDSMGVQSRKCYEVACRHGKPVIVMEPVKGGTLAQVPAAVEETFRAAHPDWTVPSWAVRFAANLDNVMMVLSGMSTLEQVADNTAYMADPAPLTEADLSMIHAAARTINGSVAIPCTGCSYCVEGCPMKIAIPQVFSLYNADKQELPSKDWTPQSEYYDNLTLSTGKASACIECGQCEEMCPQHLHIIDLLKDVAAHFEE